MQKIVSVFICLFLSVFSSLQAIELLEEKEGRYFYRILREESVPDAFSQTAQKMYFSTYNPALHEGLSLEQMGIPEHFGTYEDFLKDMIQRDFASYNEAGAPRDIFFTTEGVYQEDTPSVVGISILLPQEDGSYYLDHFGVSSSAQRHGIGKTLMGLWFLHLKDLNHLTLDTREFNTTGQSFYNKHGFEEVSPHPVVKKRGFYKYFQIDRT